MVSLNLCKEYPNTATFTLAPDKELNILMYRGRLPMS